MVKGKITDYLQRLFNLFTVELKNEDRPEKGSLLI